MKKYLLLGVYGLLATTTLAQHSPQVPTPVLQAFAKAQPQAAHVAWHQCPVGYEAVFEQRPAQGRLPGERKYRGVARLTPAGELVETRLDVPARTLPPLGHTAVSQRYPRRQVDRIIQVVDAKGEVTYEAKICEGKDKNGKDKDCQTSRFDANGRPLTI
ncbi:MAG: hypothetical protein EOO55_00140 [Hymenobacter sp.]|nr:MAG: hypothetical protein EOO55_00140 [Hymenobacter sp.]